MAGTRHTRHTKDLVIEYYAQMGRIDLACKKARVNRSMHYDWLKGDEEYATKFEQARESVAQMLEDEAFRRAHDGIPKPITVAKKRELIREYSDTLLVLLLKAARPEKYRERYDATLNGKLKLDGVVTMTLEDMVSEMKHLRERNA